MHHERPPNFPPRTLPIMRALAALGSTSQSDLQSAMDALWEEFFVKHTQTEEPTALRRILSEVLDSPVLADGLLTRAASDSVDGGKTILSSNTEKAFRDGAFGVPWMVCTRSDGQRQSFWGVDHLGRLAAFLELEKPATGKWRSLL
jgi:2-hydroxychromene-2-carboxylate isomerase